MAMRHLNRVKFVSSTTGTSDLTVGAASGTTFLTPAEAGAVSGDNIDYLIEEGNDFEIGRGTLSGAPVATLVRTTVFISKVSGSVGTTKMNCNGNALIRFIQAADDMLTGPITSITDGFLVLWDATNRKLKQGAGAPGTAALKNTGTSGNNVPVMNAKNAWSAPQLVTESALTTATAWDGDVVQNLTVTVSGANFDIANPSPVPAAGGFVNIKVVYSSAHIINWGNKYKGLTGITGSGNGKTDNYSFRSDGTNLHCTGSKLDVAS